MMTEKTYFVPQISTAWDLYCDCCESANVFDCWSAESCERAARSCGWIVEPGCAICDHCRELGATPENLEAVRRAWN